MKCFVLVKKGKGHTCQPPHSSRERLSFAECDFCNAIFVQSEKFGFQRSYQTFSIRLKTVGDKKTHSSLPGLSSKILIEQNVNILTSAAVPQKCFNYIQTFHLDMTLKGKNAS